MSLVRSHVRAACALAAVLAFGTVGAAHAQSVPSTPTVPVYRLEQLMSLAREAHPALAAARARTEAARAAVVTAGALPNPEIELLAGPQRARMPGATAGSGRSFSLTQPLELPGMRAARRDAAQAALGGAQATAAGDTVDLLSELKRRYHETQRSDAALRSAREDLALANQIRERVGVRVSTGEAPRFELVRADTEQLNAQRALQAAELQLRQSQQQLRRVVGPALPVEFELAREPDDVPAGGSPQPLVAMRAALLERHPALVAARADLRAAEARLQLEKQQRLPRFALRGTVEREPDLQAHRIGVVMTVPLFDRRAGPVAEAQAELERLRNVLADRELQLGQQLEVAWQQYHLAGGQVSALESGIVRQAESAMRIAEAAYRAGERGVLEWLDAQRAFRQARNDLNNARYDLRAALVELERLQGALR